MANKRPEKTIYQNQKEVHDFIIDKLESEQLKNAKEAYLIGSLAEGKFGKYVEEYEGYFGSDIDLVVIPSTIPKEWKYEGDFYNWHKRYFGGIIIYNGISHPIHIQIPFDNNIELFYKKAKELNWKIEKLK